MKDFKINEFLTLKLEHNKTNIYIKDKLFKQCKFLLLNIYIDKISSFDGIESIDEVAEQLDNSMEEDDFFLPPEIEFWGHCSNLQVWVDNNYNTRILHRNIAFPLLKALTEEGDLKAKKVFREEIAKRFKEGDDKVRNFLIIENYLRFLSQDELITILPEEYSVLKDIEEILDKRFDLYANDEDLNRRDENIIGFSLDKNGNIVRIFFHKYRLNMTTLEKIFDKLKYISSLKFLDFTHCNLTSIPESIGNIVNLTTLILEDNALEELPNTFSELIHLKDLFLSNNKIKKIPESIGNMISLVNIDLSNNNLRSIPNSIKKINSLRYLNIKNNNLNKLSKSIEDLNSIKLLRIIK